VCASGRWDGDWWGPRNEEPAQVVPKEGGVVGRQGLWVVEQGQELVSKGWRKDGEDVFVEGVEAVKYGADEVGWQVGVVVDHVGKDGVEKAAHGGGATGKAREDDVPDGEGSERGVVVGDYDGWRRRWRRNGGGRGGGVAHVVVGKERTRGAWLSSGTGLEGRGQVLRCWREAPGTNQQSAGPEEKGNDGGG
jgi:hypothetical protein